jgi:enhancing lycopene biosynthesis protein 2
MIESARITRGNIKPIDKLFASDFDALFIPGGKILNALSNSQMKKKDNFNFYSKDLVLLKICN